MSLFEYGKFISHSGLELPWKFDADFLTPMDLASLALIVKDRIQFGQVVGVPRGGLRFAEALRPYGQIGQPTLIVDDVLTTGRSMIDMYELLRASGHTEIIFGVVILSRAGDQRPDWVSSILDVSVWANRARIQ